MARNDRQWFEQNGMLPYVHLDGPELTAEQHEDVMNFKSPEDEEALRALLEAEQELINNDPVGYNFTPAMCEVYFRLGQLFPDKGPIWKRTEMLIHFGKY